MATSTPKKTDVHVTSIDDDLPTESTVTTSKELAVTDHNDAFTGDKVELMISSGATEADKQAVFIGINGHPMLVPRDTWVVVAHEVAEQLDNCTMDIYTPLEGGGVQHSVVRRFATSVRLYKPAK